MVLTTDLTNSFWTKDGWNCGIQLHERNHEIVQFQMKNGRQCTSVANIFVKPDTCQCFARAVDLIWGSDFCLHSLLARHVYAFPLPAATKPHLMLDFPSRHCLTCGCSCLHATMPLSQACSLQPSDVLYRYICDADCCSTSFDCHLWYWFTLAAVSSLVV